MILQRKRVLAVILSLSNQNIEISIDRRREVSLEMDKLITFMKWLAVLLVLLIVILIIR